jgi:hypothetical protein
MDKRVVAMLAGIVVMLAGYLFFFERGQLSSKEVGDRKGRALDSFVRDRVEELTVTHGAQKLRFARKRLASGELGAFALAEPQAMPADENAVDSLMGELEWLSVRRALDGVSAKDRTEFGLDAPSFTVDYRVADTVHQLRVGKPDVHGESHYAQLDDAPRVMLLPKTLVEALDHTPGHFRSKQFLGDITSAWARKLEIQAGGPRISVEKVGGRFWVADAPRSFADDERVGDLVAALDRLRATRFVEGDALHRLNVPSLVPVSHVTLKTIPDDAREDQKPEAFTLTVFGACPEHADERVARAGEQGDFVCVLTSDVKDLLDVLDLRETHLLPAAPEDVVSIQLSGPGAHFDLKRKEGAWEAVTGPKVETKAVNGWLSALHAERGAYVAPAAYGTSDHMLTLGLSGDRRAAMALSTLPSGELAIVREHEAISLRFGGDAPLLMAVLPARFGRVAPWDQRKPSEVQALVAQVGSTTRALKLVDGRFCSGPRDEPVADTFRVRELVRQVLKWEASVYVGEGGLPAHGFATPEASLTLQLTPTERLRMVVGKACAGGRYLLVDAHGVYCADNATLARIYELAEVPVPASLAPAMGSGQVDDATDDEPELPGHDHDHGHTH